jgi:hypothetical protein
LSVSSLRAVISSLTASLLLSIATFSLLQLTKRVVARVSIINFVCFMVVFFYFCLTLFAVNMTPNELHPGWIRRICAKGVGISMG